VVVYEDLQKDEVKERIRSETRKKAGIYGIFNLVTGDFYIGSAISNRFYSRFYRHLIKGLGSKPVSNSVKKYGLENFAFVILEYFPVEVTKKNNQDLMAFETSWIKKCFPSYNILLEAGNSFGYKHTEDSKQKMKDNYSEERKKQIGSINKGKNLSNKVKAQLREKALNRTEEVKNKYRMASSKPVTVYKQDGTFYASFPGIRVMAKHFQCDHKTINKAILNNTFKKQFYVKLDDKK
jgi:group I intron endonuclease